MEIDLGRGRPVSSIPYAAWSWSYDQRPQTVRCNSRFPDVTSARLRGHKNGGCGRLSIRQPCQLGRAGPAHAKSPDYAVASFLEDPEFISHVVRFDLPLLGDVLGKRGVHLQCHIGTDTISLARLGARMSGLDFSLPALEEARRLAAATGADIAFVQADLYDAVDALGRDQFDLVYTGIGALCWLPDIDRWASVVGQLLMPGGRLFLREGHPMLWTLEDVRADGLLVVEHPYFDARTLSYGLNRGRTSVLTLPSSTTQRTCGTMASEKSRPRSWLTAWRSLVSSNTTPFRGMPFRARWRGCRPASSAWPFVLGG